MDGRGDIWEYSIWATKRCPRPNLTSEVTSKTCQNDFKLHTCGWFGMIFENIQSDLPNEVRGQSWPRRSLQKHVKMTSNYILVVGLGWYLRIFRLNSLGKQSRGISAIITAFFFFFLIVIFFFIFFLLLSQSFSSVIEFLSKGLKLWPLVYLQ